MRRIFPYISVFVLSLAFVACTRIDKPQDRAIKLYFASDNLQVETKAEAEAFGSAPTKETPFTAEVWFSLTKGKYEHNPSANEELSIPAKVPVTFTSTQATDAILSGKNLLYPLDPTPDKTQQDPVYCVGLYPGESPGDPGWSYELIDNSKTKFTHTINGSQDLMFADQLKGSYNVNFAPQNYKHLLTWVKVNASATSAEAAKVWGQVTGLSVGSRESSVEVIVSGDSDTEIADSDTEIAFSGDTLAIAAKDVPGKNPKGLSVIGQTVASLFCSGPYTMVKNSNNTSDPLGYWITVSTDKITDAKSVFVPITWDSGISVQDRDPKGKLFIINLYFNEVSVVSGVCTLHYWEDTAEDLYLGKQQ